MEGFSSYKVIHNGYKIEFCRNMEQVNEYINDVVSNGASSGIKIQKILDKTYSIGDKYHKKLMRLVRFQYSTLYEEDFIVEIS